MSPKSTKFSSTVYQLKIALLDSNPLIWRRLLVLNNISLYKLHQIIQIAMGWTNSHLHKFVIEDEIYSIPSADDWEPVIDEREYRLNKIIPSENSKFIYLYDFGDSWEHEVLVEKTIQPETDAIYPVCIEGKRACPPEDVGGIGGYEEFLEATSDPDHDNHDSFLEWLGGEFVSEDFDLPEINRSLSQIK